MELNDVHKQIVCSLYNVTNDYEGKIKCIVTVNMLLWIDNYTRNLWRNTFLITYNQTGKHHHA